MQNPSPGSWKRQEAIAEEQSLRDHCTGRATVLFFAWLFIKLYVVLFTTNLTPEQDKAQAFVSFLALFTACIYTWDVLKCSRNIRKLKEEGAHGEAS